MDYRRGLGFGFVLLAAVTVMACGGRDPGPSEREYGKILFWEVESVELEWDQCTDSPEFRDGLSAPDFEENSFIVYRVSDDGSELVDQDCETTIASSCEDSGLDLVFERDGSDYVYDQEPAVGEEVAPGCSVISDPLWVLSDEGTELFLDVGVTFGLEGDGCEGVDENIAKTGMNEFGIDGCTTTIAVVANFYRSGSP